MSSIFSVSIIIESLILFIGISSLCIRIDFPVSPVANLYFLHLKYPSGSTYSPFILTPKCKCGPVELPVFPDYHGISSCYVHSDMYYCCKICNSSLILFNLTFSNNFPLGNRLSPLNFCFRNT